MPTCEHPIVAANPSDPSVNDAPDKERIEPPFSSFSVAFPVLIRHPRDGPNGQSGWLVSLKDGRFAVRLSPGSFALGGEHCRSRNRASIVKQKNASQYDG